MHCPEHANFWQSKLIRIFYGRFLSGENKLAKQKKKKRSTRRFFFVLKCIPSVLHMLCILSININLPHPVRVACGKRGQGDWATSDINQDKPSKIKELQGTVPPRRKGAVPTKRKRRLFKVCLFKHKLHNSTRQIGLLSSQYYLLIGFEVSRRQYSWQTHR